MSIKRNEKQIKYYDMTPIIRDDVFVNDDFKGATINNIGRYLESKNKKVLRKRAEKRLVRVGGNNENL